ncbi:MAG: hypothetical protein ACOH18_03105 [Candidatus Saccharimonadaceae bacterium]
MNPLFLAVRAVSSEFARRIYLPFVWTIGGILFALLLVVGWLTTMNQWWWLLLIPGIIFLSIFILVSLVVGVAITILKPVQSKDQRIAVGAFVDELQEVSEVLGMTKFWLLLRLAQDTIFPSGKGFVGRISSQALSLKPDFQEIVASFR